MTITKKTIASACVGARLADNNVTGLRLHKGKSRATWFVRYYTKTDKRERRLKLGYYPTITIEQARDIAREILVEVARGNDPAQKEDTITVHQLYVRFMDDMAKQLKRKTLKEYELTYHRYLKQFSRYSLGCLRKSEVVRMHTGAPIYAGNRALALLSRLYTYANSLDLIGADINPARGIRRNAERPRTRYAGTGELSRIGRGIREWSSNTNTRKQQFADLLHLLILTGARLSEIQGCKNVYLDLSRRAIRLPDSKTGAKDIYISDEALPIIKRNYNAARTYLFQHAALEEPFKGEHNLWRQFKEQYDISGLRMHDLRRSYATYAKSKGMTLDNIKELLGHSTIKTTETHYAFLKEDVKAEAGEQVSKEMSYRLSSQAAGS